MRVAGDGENSSAEYRSGRAWWDIEQRDSVFGALGNGVVLGKGVEGLEVHQHLVRLVDAAIQAVHFVVITPPSHLKCVDISLIYHR